MNGRDLRKLRRSELLELMLEFSKENDRLKAENRALKKQLDSREIRFRDAGSLAEAALAVSGVFEKAQEAADLYLTNIRRAGAEAQKADTDTAGPAKTQRLEKPVQALPRSRVQEPQECGSGGLSVSDRPQSLLGGHSAAR